MSKILVAMSGGVDSAVTALRLLEAGHTVIGATLLLSDAASGGCASGEEAEAARQVAERLGIVHHALPFEKEFQAAVIEPFVRAYERGETPNPCVLCNRHLKFGVLHRFASELGCDAVATGHYARTEGGRLFKARDPLKDQSYVLWTLTAEQLSRTLFPLGDMTKDEVRAIAAAHGFPNADRPESQDICFIKGQSYIDYIRAYTGRDYPMGDFVDKDGRVLGRHKGILCYTVGQRKGLGISLGRHAFVTAIRPESNTVVLGDEEELYAESIRVREFNLLVPQSADSFACAVKTRYRQSETPATVLRTGEDTARITFTSPVRAPARGQSAVLYDGDAVLGGGIIC